MRCGHEDLLNMATPWLEPHECGRITCCTVSLATHPSMGKTCASAVSKFVAKHLPKFQVKSQANLHQMSRGTRQHFEMASMNWSCSLLCTRNYCDAQALPLVGLCGKGCSAANIQATLLGLPLAMIPPIVPVYGTQIIGFRSNVRKSPGHREKMLRVELMLSHLPKHAKYGVCCPTAMCNV